MIRGVHEYCSREASDFAAGAVLASDCRIMSEPSRVWAAEHKLFQLVLAKASGLAVPDAVVTNDADEIRRTFEAFDGQMIGKPVRSGFVDLGEEQRAIYTTKICHENLDDLSGAKLSPVIFQRLIPKDRDIRVTVVGDRIFTAAIDSCSDPSAVIDWRRTQNPDLPHSIFHLPEWLETKVLRLMERLGLAFGALDFVLTPEGQYIFLGVGSDGGADVASSVWDLAGDPKRTSNRSRVKYASTSVSPASASGGSRTSRYSMPPL